MHRSRLSTMYTPLNVTTMIYAHQDCWARTCVYILPQPCTSQRLSCTAVLKYVKSHWYPKSIMTIFSGGHTGVQEATKLWAFRIAEADNMPIDDSIHTNILKQLNCELYRSEEKFEKLDVCSIISPRPVHAKYGQQNSAELLWTSTHNRQACTGMQKICEQPSQ